MFVDIHTPSLLQQDISIRCSLLFIAQNRKTRFPAFSLPNGLERRREATIPSRTHPKATQKARETKAGPFFSQIFPWQAARACQLSALISCRFSGKDRELGKLPAQEARICSAGVGIYLLGIHHTTTFRPEEKPAVGRQK